jgi:biopolymer transport protein ExbB/TolQ
MNTAFDVIVIILSVFLLVYLILSVIVLSLVLRLLKSLRQVVAKGEHLVDNAEHLTETLRANAGAVGLIKLLLKFVNKK